MSDTPDEPAVIPDRDAPVGSPEREAWQHHANESFARLVGATDPVPFYAISEVALDAITDYLFGPPSGITKEAQESLGGFIRAVRENGPIQDDPSPLDFEDMMSQRDTETRTRATATRQRDFLMGQVDSLIQRLSGAHVAAGLLAMPAAQGFAQKEVFPINQVLAQIEQADKPTP